MQINPLDILVESRPPGIHIATMVSGSHAYGLETPESDFDLVTLWSYTQQQVAGFAKPLPSNTIKHQDPCWEHHHWQIGHFLHTALSGAAPALEVLWTEPLIGRVWTTSAFAHKSVMEELVPYRDGFITHEMVAAHFGHSKHMLKRALKNFGTPAGGKYAMHAFRLLEQVTELVTRRTLTLPLPADTQRRLRAYRSPYYWGTPDALQADYNKAKSAVTCMLHSVNLPQKADPLPVEQWLITTCQRLWSIDGGS